MSAPSRPGNVSHDAIRVARESYARCCEAPDFFTCFYRNFFKRNPAAEPFFAATNFKRQHQLLRHAIGLLLIFPNQPPPGTTLLNRVAERHSRRELAVHPSYYPDFVESLIQTVREHDPACDPETERAWREAVAPGVAFMQASY
jgi:hemoglobin-like flavoprotein